MSEELRAEVSGAGGVRIAARQTGPPSGPPVVLMHGLTMTRDHVMMGSNALEQEGFRVIAYDARGHGQSAAPADPGEYGYDALSADLVAVMDAFGAARALLVGSSLGCHTAIRLALAQPDRVAGLVAITPAFGPDGSNRRQVDEASELAAALRRGGIDEFLLTDTISDRTGRALVRRRLLLHDDLLAVADSMEGASADRPFEAYADLAAITVPALVVGTRDEFDRRHPYALARAYARALPDSRFVCEEPGRAPLAWSRRKMGPLVVELARSAHWEASGDRGHRRPGEPGHDSGLDVLGSDVDDGGQRDSGTRHRDRDSLAARH